MNSIELRKHQEKGSTKKNEPFIKKAKKGVSKKVGGATPTIKGKFGRKKRTPEEAKRNRVYSSAYHQLMTKLRKTKISLAAAKDQATDHARLLNLRHTTAAHPVNLTW